MGHFSDLAISMNEGPQLTERETYVCEDCVADDALQELVRENLASNVCSYCGDENEDGEVLAAPFDVIMLRIYESVSKYYSDAQDTSMPRVDKDWLVDQTYTGIMLMEFDPGWEASFSEDVSNSFDSSAYWVEHVDGDWAIENPSHALSYGWKSFKEQVLTKTRYLFLAEPEEEHSSGRPDYIPIATMLDALGSVCKSENLISTVPAGTEFFRVRHASKQASKQESFSCFSEMGVPPIGDANAGRMNPAGISYFYVGYDQVTAEKEVLDWSKHWFVAKYVIKEEMTVIDFSWLPKIPSLFEPDLYESRHNGFFLHEFTSDLVEPVSKDGREHVDYVPTQIVSEYFRHRFFSATGDKVLGIKYPSVKNEGGLNLAVFSSSNEELESLFELQDISEFRV